MDFALPHRARRSGCRGGRRRSPSRGAPDVAEDGWIIGHDTEFALELARHHWLGMTWPVEAGGQGRSPFERFVVFEALHRQRRSGRGFVVRRSADRSDAPAVRHGRAAGAMVAGDRRRHAVVVHRHERARRRHRCRVAADQSRPRRRPLGRRRAEGLDQRRRARRLVLPDRSDRSRRAAACGPVRARRRHARPGISVAPIIDMTGEPPLLRGHLRRRRRAGCSPCRRAQRQLPPGDAADGTRAGRHRPARSATVRCTSDCLARWPTSPMPIVRQEIAATRDRLSDRPPASFCGRCWAKRHAEFSAATKTFCTEFEQRVGVVLRAVLGPYALLAEPGLAGPRRTQPLLRARVHDHGRYHADPAIDHRRASARTPPLRCCFVAEPEVRRRSG